MSRKLGETLVAAGKITDAQLHRALTGQLVFGGHLGSSLLELGYIDEETLGETLSAAFGVPYADADAIAKVPYAVVRSLPARLVEKHKVVPLKLEGRTLHLAMIDPKNLLALDEISFVTGYRIVPWVSPEIRILEALETYYNLQRSQRFTTLSRELSSLRTRRERPRPLQGETALLHGGAAQAGPARAAAVADGAAAPRPKAVSAAAVAAAESAADPWERYGYGRSWREVAEAIEGQPAPAELKTEEVDTRPQPTAVARGRAQRTEPPAVPSLQDVSQRLAAAQRVEEIVDIVLAYVAGRLRRSIFFVVKRDRAIGWAGRGEGLTEAAVRSLDLPQRGASSLFALVGDRPAHYLGALPPAQAGGEMYARLGISSPRTALLVPIAVKGRVAAYLYGDGGDQEILALDLPAVLSLCARAGFAFQIAILRNKIIAG